MKLCAIVVVYEPSEVELLKNIMSLKFSVDKIVVWLNSKISIQLIDNLIIEDVVILTDDNKNVGIARGLNEGIKWAIFKEYTHVLTMDQDSWFERDMLLKYKNLILTIQEENIGMFGINPIQDGNSYYKSTFIDNVSLPQYKVVNDTLTSGSIFPISVFKKVGFFEEDLFIDAVDYEFCYRMKVQRGLDTVVFPNMLMNHQSGYSTKVFFGLKSSNYSSFRTYFIIRNQIIIHKRYPRLFSKKHQYTLYIKHILYRFIMVVFGEKNKWKKIKAIVMGSIDGIKGDLRFKRF